ncbi:MAG: hypothetical protein M1833_000368 [Piccolia ochrophora]|nr:MAG: hypothetical protein M1833_000368 [Piccolia ochrophora]
MSNFVSAVLLCLVAILCPPVAVGIIGGCGADLFINIALTILGYLPGHIHAFYILYIYFSRREDAIEGRITGERAPGVYSDRIQAGGQGYGTIVQQT